MEHEVGVPRGWFLKRQFRYIAKTDLASFRSNTWSQHFQRKESDLRRPPNNPPWMEEEIRANPSTRRQLERMRMVSQRWGQDPVESQTGFPIGLSEIPSRWVTAGTSASTRPAKHNAEDPTIVRSESMVGSVMRRQPSAQLQSAQTSPTGAASPSEGRHPSKDRFKWQPVDISHIHTPVILLLYSGKADAGSLDSCIHAYHPHLSPHVIAVGKRRGQGVSRTCHTTCSAPWRRSSCLERIQVVPQTKCPAPSERKGRKRGMGAGGLDGMMIVSWCSVN